MSKREDGTLSFTVDAGSSGQRIDKFLTSRIENTSRSYVQNIIGRDKVKVNGKVVNKHYRLAENDKITVESFEEDKSYTAIEPQKINLKIVYEDDYLLVISKKSGVLTHPVPGFSKDTVVNALLYHYDKLSNLSGKDRAGIVHRLDKDTSGLLIIARDDNTHRLLSEKFKEREIIKTYTALVWGSFSESKGEIILPIGRSRMDRKKMSISIDRGRDAVTRFEVKEEFENSTLLDIHPETGRTHQIRVHLSYIGHPIIGDAIYGSAESKKMAEELGIGRQFLHAKRLEFTHPVTGKQIVLEDKLSDDLLRCLKILRRTSNHPSGLS
ncbi:MAG: RluA family pseudouridine synthase [Actinobacteria bacterium]|nr:RluA family pseudouridine synthase [Actinomycetota bacterium]MBE3113956.1 RluA family pseudouridine synthase [Actinomycetota bacterium]